MTGSNSGIIAIVIVPVVALTFWLIMVYYASSHPQWRGQTQAEGASTHALPGAVPAQRLSSPGPVVPGQRPSADADELTRAEAGQRNPKGTAS